MNRLEERGEELAAVRQDGLLKQLLRIYLSPPQPAEEAGAADVSNLTPALFSAYRDLDALRYDFPVVLLDGPDERVGVPLSSLMDELVARKVADGTGDGRQRRDLYKLERSIKTLTAQTKEQRLGPLWRSATKRCLAEIDGGKRREALRNYLRSARSTLSQDGLVVDCDEQIGHKFFSHAWTRIESERGLQTRETLDELIADLSAIIDADRMRSARATSSDALRTAMGAEHAGGIDFDRLSWTLRSSGHYRPLKASRRKRLRRVLKVLKTERKRLGSNAGNGKSPRRPYQPKNIADSCVDALELFNAELERAVELFRAVRIARLEVENRYDEARHDPFFAGFDQAQLTTEELRALPTVLVFVANDSLDGDNKAALIDILSSDLPIKVVLEFRDLPDSLPLGAGSVGYGGWAASLGSMTMGLRTALVIQTAASHLPRLTAEIADGLRHNGPALFCVYTGPEERDIQVSRYLRCASAVESRAFPCFVYHPGRGSDWAQRFSLLGNPEPEQPHPKHVFNFEDADGRERSEEIAFTVVDFLAMDTRFSAQFVPIGPEEWHPNMIPLGSYLGIEDSETFGKVPYVLMVDQENTLHRVIVRRGLVTAARRCADKWHSLQELGGIENSHALRLLQTERQRMIEQTGTEPPVASEPEPVAEDIPVPAAEPTTGDEPEPQATTAAGEQAHIETELCTSCDDCTDRNSMMFAYNDAKQAYIKDITAGTFRELVEASENCPVCIIHPGAPSNPDELGLEDLVRRASQFN
ncbi:MAG: hypothetical protein MAG794_01153 [Gammaproteobacteria bacterium]|nr:hypothetical protein [Gammaproteobacteria bacterium]